MSIEIVSKLTKIEITSYKKAAIVWWASLFVPFVEIVNLELPVARELFICNYFKKNRMASWVLGVCRTYGTFEEEVEMINDFSWIFLKLLSGQSKDYLSVISSKLKLIVHLPFWYMRRTKTIHTVEKLAKLKKNSQYVMDLMYTMATLFEWE